MNPLTLFDNLSELPIYIPGQRKSEVRELPAPLELEDIVQATPRVIGLSWPMRGELGHKRPLDGEYRVGLQVWVALREKVRR